MKRASQPVTGIDLDESGVRDRAPSLTSAPIATGGMGSVHLVRGPDGRLLALKRLHPHLAKDEYFTAMLHDEATIAASIAHENVVTTYGLDAYEGAPCLVMDYVPGLSVSEVIRHAHPLGIPVPVALKIVADALRGLHAAHEARDASGRPLAIVHRDVSPQNILVGVDGSARVLDFGIAKAAHRVHSTRPGDIKGKLAYMAPEQLTGAEVDRRTDVRGAGVVLWEMLTSAPLFHARREEDCVAKILSGRVRRPSELGHDIPADVDAIVMRALAREPEDRFPTALAMAEAIEEVMLFYVVSTRAVGEWLEDIGADALAELPTIPSVPTAPTLPQRAVPTKKARAFGVFGAKLADPIVLFLSALVMGAGGGFFIRQRFLR